MEWEGDLQNTVTVTSVAKVFEAKVSFSLWELLAQCFLQFWTRHAHQT